MAMPPPEVIAAVVAPGTPAAPFDSRAQSADAMRTSLACLTAAVYHEARSEGEEGQRAVAQVVLNRVRHPAFPNSVCGVVYQGSARATGCQFSFTCDGSLGRRHEPGAWARAATIAEEALAGAVYATVGLATHYHTTAIRPWWAASLARAVTVGSHIFYRWRGDWGDPKAFRQPYSGQEAGPATPPTRIASAQGERTAFGVVIHRGAIAPVEENSGPVRVHRSDGVSEVAVHAGRPPGQESLDPAASGDAEAVPAR